MEDAATAEISRSQIWQWVHERAKLADGPTISKDLVAKVRDEELAKVKKAVGDEAYAQGKYEEAASLFDEVALSDEFVEFLTLPGYDRLD